MKYPTLEQVEHADRIQLATWYRFLPSPANEAVGNKDFYKILEKEAKIMNRICERFSKMGNFTPEISKAIGWEK